MSGDPVNVDVLIIGAGMSGLIAANVIEQQGLTTTVIDKGRSVGGRMATRRVGPGIVDHGAQFFTARTPEFQAMIDEWIQNRVAYVWSNGFSDGSLQTVPRDGHPRYAVHGGMNNLAKYLARDLRDVRVNSKIVTATCDDNGWILQDEEGGLFVGRCLLMTAPVPQSLQILDEGATVLTRDDFALLSSIEYAPCLTGIFWVDGVVTLPEPGAVQRRNSNITWISDNRTKGISPDATLVTVQASDAYSSQMWSAPDGRILNALRTDLEIFLRDGAVIREAQLKRWRYSRPTNPMDILVYAADNEPPLFFAGDAFASGRVEGAVLSGLDAGHQIAELLR